MSRKIDKVQATRTHQLISDSITKGWKWNRHRWWFLVPGGKKGDKGQGLYDVRTKKASVAVCISETPCITTQRVAPPVWKRIMWLAWHETVSYRFVHTHLFLWAHSTRKGKNGIKNQDKKLCFFLTEDCKLRLLCMLYPSSSSMGKREMATWIYSSNI